MTDTSKYDGYQYDISDYLNFQVFSRTRKRFQENVCPPPVLNRPIVSLKKAVSVIFIFFLFFYFYFISFYFILFFFFFFFFFFCVCVVDGGQFPKPKP